MFWRRRNVDDFSEEVRAHLEHEEAELRAGGLSADDARAEARRRFGNVTLARERVFDGHPLRWLEVLWRDVKHGVRLMRRSPAFSTTAVIVLSLGIGVNTALFSIVNALFFKPLPIERPEELFYLYDVLLGGQRSRSMAAERFEFIRSQSEALAEFTSSSRIPSRLSIDGDTGRAAGEIVQANYFDFLGVTPSIGRAFRADDDDPSNPELAVVLGHELWATRFSADPSVVGREVRIEERFYRVIGVAPPRFAGLSDPWRPSQFWVTAVQAYGRRVTALGPVGRLKPGVSFDAVRAFVVAKTPELREYVLARGGPRLREEFPNWLVGVALPVHRVVDVAIPENPDAKLVPDDVLAGMVTVVALVLVIASANIAGLLLARGVTRTGEVAVRRALGASARRVTGQLLTEAILLALAGGALAVAISATLVGLFRAFTPSRLALDVTVDARVLLFAVALCIGAGLVVGLAPALQAARVNVLEALGSGIVGARVVRTRLRHGIVVPQIALSLVLVLVAAVHLRALMKVEARPLGYEPADTMALTVNRWAPRSSAERARMTAEQRRERDDREAGQIRAFIRQVLERVGRVPQVQAAALTMTLPVSAPEALTRPVLSLDDYTVGRRAQVRALRSIVSDHYFDVLRMRILRGRGFDERDGPYEAFGPRVAVVSESLARQLWPTGDPIGRSLSWVPDRVDQPPVWLEVIGVVNDVEPALDDEGARARLYEPLKQQWQGWVTSLVVRTNGMSPSLIRDLKTAVIGADAHAEVLDVRTMRQVIGEIRYPRRVAAAVLMVAGAIGLALACIGLYGVVSYSVAQRVREIGIRTTLGAGRADIIALVLKDGAIIGGAGTVAGVGLAWMALRSTAGMFPWIPRMDVLSFVSVPLCLGAVILAACLLPARRASRVDPAQVLRGC